MTPQEEIEELLARIAMGDRKAFSALYARTSAKLFGICLRILPDRAEAEEALQEAFLRIWNRADRYVANGYSPMTWLITLTRNIAIDRRRKKSPDTGASLDAADLVADKGPTPEGAAVRNSEARVLERCLRELERQRAVMVRAAYLNGYSYAEIAAASGVKLNTVRTWLRRSLLQLRDCLTQ